MSTKRFRPGMPPSVTELRRRVERREVTCVLCARAPAVAALSVDLYRDHILTWCVCLDCYNVAAPELLDLSTVAAGLLHELHEGRRQ